MLKTIEIGTHLSIQGRLVETLQDGLCRIRVGGRVFTGRPINS